MTIDELIQIADPPIVGHRDDFHMLWIGDGSVWFNPFSIDDFGREGAFEKYEEYVHNRPDLMALIPALRGETLACTCRYSSQFSPMCHGDSLVKIYLEWSMEMLKQNPNYFGKKA